MKSFLIALALLSLTACGKAMPTDPKTDKAKGIENGKPTVDFYQRLTYRQEAQGDKPYFYLQNKQNIFLSNVRWYFGARLFLHSTGNFDLQYFESGSPTNINGEVTSYTKMIKGSWTVDSKGYLYLFLDKTIDPKESLIAVGSGGVNPITGGDEVLFTFKADIFTPGVREQTLLLTYERSATGIPKTF